MLHIFQIGLQIAESIQLGGLVQKARLVELTEDDGPALLGAFLGIATKLQGDVRE